MKLKNLTLKNFRNYKEEKIEFSEGINIFFGENAQGKTNILEALYLFSSSKSHRGVRDKDLIMFGEDESVIEIAFDSQKREQTAKYNIFGDKNKKLFINDIENKRLKALFGIFTTVIFSPEDLNLIKEGPEERRRFMDTDISQLKPEYYNILKDYKKVMFSKNNLLKNENCDLNLLDVYNEKLSLLAAKITVHRIRFVERINSLTDKALFYISEKKENVSLKYVPGFSSEFEVGIKAIAEAIKKELDEIRDEEIKKGVCLIGPHRDDISFYLNGKDARLFCSQGQQRSIVLSLKLAEYEFMKEVTGEPPLLLLDDILSELDIKRQGKLINFIRDNQTVITCTDKDLYGKIKYPVKSFNVKEGKVISL